MESTETTQKPADGCPVQSLVTLCLTALYADQRVHLRKTAPPLPQGVCWQSGMWLEVKEDAYEVDYVAVKEDGAASVTFKDEKFDGSWADSENDTWREGGWTVTGMRPRGASK